MIYLDHAASTPLHPRAYALLSDSLKKDFANPSSIHTLGRSLQKDIERSRRFFLDSLGVGPSDHFIFTSSATESNNTVIRGLQQEGEGGGRDVVFYSPADHPSVTRPCETLAASHRGGGRILLREIPLKKGMIDVLALLEQLDERARLVILGHVNSQSGHIHDLFNISQKIKEKAPRVWIHGDSAQGYGKFPLKAPYLDSLAVSSHKIGGPKGIAGLYLKARARVRVRPLLEGGGQEGGWRASTLAPSLIFSFEEAARQSLGHWEKNLAHVQRLNDLGQDLLQDIPSIIFPFGRGDHLGPYILMFILPRIPSDILLRHLEREEIFLSSTSACSSRIKGKNPVYSALGIEEKWHKFVLRASFSYQTSENDVRIFCRTLRELYGHLCDL